MKSYSSEVEKRMDDGSAVFYQTARITFTNGSVLELEPTDFYMDGNDFGAGAGLSALPLGATVAKSINMTLINDTGRFEHFDFYLAHIIAWVNIDLDTTTESWKIGEFVVTTPEKYGDAITLNAVDFMYKADTEYTTNLGFPATLQEVLQDSCDTLQIPLLTGQFYNYNLQIMKKPSDITHRQLWGYIAQIACGNAVLDEDNALKIITWETRIASAPHIFMYHKEPTIDTDDVIITGISTTVDDKKYLAGAEGYVLDISNPLIEDVENVLGLMSSKLVGFKFRNFSIEHGANPFVEFGDPCIVVDRHRNGYNSYVTDYVFTYFGATSIKCQSDSPLRNSSKKLDNTAKIVQKLKAEVKAEMSQYEVAMKQITELAANSMGLFATQEEMADGSKIYYWHDKAELENSQTIWRMSKDAFTVSTDGGQTWNAGIDASGRAIVNILSAIGIRFDWAKGGVLSLGGDNNTNGQIKIYNANGEYCGQINNSGIAIFSPTTKTQVILSPDVGLVRRDADGNEFDGIFHKDSFYLPVEFASNKLELAISDYHYSDGTPYLQEFETPFRGNRYCSDNDDSNAVQEQRYTGSSFQYRWTVNYTHKSARVVTSISLRPNRYEERTVDFFGTPFTYVASIFDNEFEYTYQLPSTFKGKKIIVAVNAEYDSSRFDDNFRLLYIYTSMKHPTCSEGYRATGDWGTLTAGVPTHPNPPLSPYINPEVEFPDEIREEYVTLKEFEFIFPTEIPEFEYEVDESNATVTVKGTWPITENGAFISTDANKYSTTFINSGRGLTWSAFFPWFIKFTIEASC